MIARDFHYIQISSKKILCVIGSVFSRRRFGPDSLLNHCGKLFVENRLCRAEACRIVAAMTMEKRACPISTYPGAWH